MRNNIDNDESFMDGELGCFEHPEGFDHMDIDMDLDGNDSKPLVKGVLFNEVANASGALLAGATTSLKIVDVLAGAQSGPAGTCEHFACSRIAGQKQETLLAGDGDRGQASSSKRSAFLQTPYDRLKVDYPRYPWGKPCANECFRLPVGPVPERWGGDRGGRLLFRKGSNHGFPLELWKPYLKYLNVLLWPPEEEQHGGAQTVLSFAEMALDFELFIGLRIQGSNTTWSRKAAIIATMWRCVQKYTSGALKKENIKGVRFQSLLPFMVQGKLNCINRRPKLLMGPKVEELLARNALRGKEFPDPHKIAFPVAYNNMKLPEPLFNHVGHELLKETLEMRCRPRRRLNGKQKVLKHQLKCS
jgi:hypothetical protein